MRRRTVFGRALNLSLPPEDHIMLKDPRMRRFYVKGFQPVTTPYVNGDDVWFRYRTPEDVRGWPRVRMCDRLSAIHLGLAKEMFDWLVKFCARFTI